MVWRDKTKKRRSQLVQVHGVITSRNEWNIPPLRLVLAEFLLVKKLSKASYLLSFENTVRPSIA